MKKILFLLLLVAFALPACDAPDPAEIPKEGSGPGDTDPVVHTLESLEISGLRTLVLKKVEIIPDQSRATSQSVFERCDELGTLDNTVYEPVPLHGNQTPCFKNVHFWDGGPGAIFGQYRPSDLSTDVWFITGEDGKVHHLPGMPQKDQGFKNDKRIRKYKGKPVYLTREDFLASFDMSSDSEEIIIASRVGRYVVIPKNNGDHIVYTDLTGGKIKRPDGSIEDIPYFVNLTRGFYKNQSDDIGYIGLGCRNLTFDASGDILEKQASAVPVALQEWLDNAVTGTSEPRCPGLFMVGGTGACDRDNDLLLCGANGFLLADSSQDVKEINWSEFGISGANPQACLTDSFIWRAAGGALHKISRDLSASEEILTGFSIYNLQCVDDNTLIIHGLNTVSFEYETFQLTVTDHSSDNIRTMITENISQFIR